MWTNRAFFRWQTRKQCSHFHFGIIPTLICNKTWICLVPLPSNSFVLSVLAFYFAWCFLCHRFFLCIFFCPLYLWRDICPDYRFTQVMGLGESKMNFVKYKLLFFSSPSTHPQIANAILAGQTVLIVWSTQCTTLNPNVFIRKNALDNSMLGLNKGSAVSELWYFFSI